MHAALAQSVERRLGKAEVGGSIPLGSLKNPVNRVKDTNLRDFIIYQSMQKKSLPTILPVTAAIFF